jgi:aryl-alcohol dehydrogenase-like predicted oxidoreductase
MTARLRKRILSISFTKRFFIFFLDLVYPARVDPNVPIEETVGAIADLIQAGKVRYARLSEAGAETLLW